MGPGPFWERPSMMMPGPISLLPRYSISFPVHCSRTFLEGVRVVFGFIGSTGDLGQGCPGMLDVV